ncbi:hypothetical protein [Flavobacterium silvaticum]|uniref:Uncharacterized protein n=1 Tax=Flavobacterium silvaticum TaxID=1852020 RepID=A0A972FV76_9FLAO|nr:hypothetical protein [Flavobacterium silvaticum]NMH28672.1 hypothetical protein [Flavobacterium silvaticum]
MRQLFLSIAFSGLVLSSCSNDSSDSEHRNTIIELTVDGVAKTYTSADVDSQNIPAEGGEPAYIELSATVQNVTATEVFFFSTPQGETGLEAAYDISYTYDGTIYYGDNSGGGFVLNITENSPNYLKGTFNGTMVSGNGDTEITITDGTFDIHH